MPIAALAIALVLMQAPHAPGVAADSDLLAAAKLADLARVRQLIAGGASVHVADLRGFTPLMWACAQGNTELVRQLLEAGATVDLRAKDGTTALMLAAQNGYTEVLRALLARGANVALARNGVTAGQLARSRGHLQAAELLGEAESLGARLIAAATDGQTVLVRQLLAVGAPFNTTNASGVSALMIAARNGDLGTVQALLSRGADATARDAQNATVYDWAERAPSTGKYVAAFLQDRGIPRTASGPTPPAEAPPVRASLQRIDRLLARVPVTTAALRAAHARARAALSRLLTLSEKWPAQSPAEYRSNLARDAAILEGALEAPRRRQLPDILEAVAADLQDKLEHCLKSGGRLGGSVIVRVRTVLGADERRSWQVFYMPKILEVSTTATPDLFPQLSSPTEELLVPGRYVMWARHPATARMGERTVVKVGEGRKELVVDLVVPAEQDP